MSAASACVAVCSFLFGGDAWLCCRCHAFNAQLQFLLAAPDWGSTGGGSHKKLQSSNLRLQMSDLGEMTLTLQSGAACPLMHLCSVVFPAAVLFVPLHVAPQRVQCNIQDKQAPFGSIYVHTC